MESIRTNAQQRQQMLSDEKKRARDDKQSPSGAGGNGKFQPKGKKKVKNPAGDCILHHEGFAQLGIFGAEMVPREIEVEAQHQELLRSCLLAPHSGR